MKYRIIEEIRYKFGETKKYICVERFYGFWIFKLWIKEKTLPSYCDDARIRNFDSIEEATDWVNSEIKRRTKPEVTTNIIKELP